METIGKYQIIVGAEVAAALGASRAWIPLGEVELKGRSANPEVFGLKAG